MLSLNVVCMGWGASPDSEISKAFGGIFREDGFEAAGLGAFAQEETVPKRGAEG